MRQVDCVILLILISVLHTSCSATLATAGEAAVFCAHAQPVSAVCFSADGVLLASSTRDEIKVWRTTDRVEQYKLSFDAPVFIKDLIFTPDAKRIVVVSNVDVQVLDLASAEILHRFEDSRRESETFAVNSDANTIASWYEDTAYRLNVARAIPRIAGDDSLRVFALNEIEPRFTFDAKNGNVFGASFSSKGKRLALLSFQRATKVDPAKSAIEVVDIRTRKVLSLFEYNHIAGSILDVGLSPDGRFFAAIVVGPRTASLVIYNVDMDKKATSRHVDRLTLSPTFSASGRLVAVRTADTEGNPLGAIQLLTVGTKYYTSKSGRRIGRTILRRLLTTETANQAYGSFAVSPDDSMMVATDGSQVRMWKILQK